MDLPRPVGMIGGPVTAVPWTFRLPVPPAGWLELHPAETADVQPIPPGRDEAETRQIIDRCLRDAQRRGAIVAFVQWRPDTDPGPTAVLNVTAIAGQDDEPDQVGALGTALGTTQESDLSPRVVEFVDLPAGRALRVRLYATGGRGPHGGDAVIDVVQYWLPVPGTRQILVASSSTTEISDGDEVAGLLDAMMDRLTIDVPVRP